MFLQFVILFVIGGRGNAHFQTSVDRRPSKIKISGFDADDKVYIHNLYIYIYISATKHICEIIYNYSHLLMFSYQLFSRRQLSPNLEDLER